MLLYIDILVNLVGVQIKPSACAADLCQASSGAAVILSAFLLQLSVAVVSVPPHLGALVNSKLMYLTIYCFSRE